MQTASPGIPWAAPAMKGCLFYTYSTILDSLTKCHADLVLHETYDGRQNAELMFNILLFFFVGPM
jgi:hypothetical protein